jgi:hypothetical protein
MQTLSLSKHRSRKAHAIALGGPPSVFSFISRDRDSLVYPIKPLFFYNLPNFPYGKGGFDVSGGGG